VALARAFRARDLGSFGKHELFVSSTTIVAGVFVYGHLGVAPYSVRTLSSGQYSSNNRIRLRGATFLEPATCARAERFECVAS
jgi:hypothetical protein